MRPGEILVTPVRSLERRLVHRLTAACSGILLASGCSHPGPIPAGEDTRGPCVPPPVAIVGQKVEIGAEFVKVGKATYSVNPTVVKLGGESASDILILDYGLCTAVQSGVLPKNDPDKHAEWIRIRLEHLRKSGGVDSARSAASP